MFLIPLAPRPMPARQTSPELREACARAVEAVQRLMSGDGSGRIELRAQRDEDGHLRILVIDDSGQAR